MVKDIEKQMQDNGLDVSQFYSMSLKIPLGSTVELTIDGKKVDVKNVTNGFNDSTDNIVKPDVTGLFEQINNDGYVRNSHLWRRWITAQTFKMLNSKDGWDSYVRKNISWKYCFTQMRNEFNAQYAMLKDNDIDEFNTRNHFFNKDTLVALIKNYLRQFQKVYRKGKLKGVKDLATMLDKVDVFEKTLYMAEHCDSTDLYRLRFIARSMLDIYIKLPMETPLCPEWKNAYRGSGAYYTLKNLIMWHGVKIKVDDHFLDTHSSLEFLNNSYYNAGLDFWKLHELLKATIADNNFDLAKSIESHK